MHIGTVELQCVDQPEGAAHNWLHHRASFGALKKDGTLQYKEDASRLVNHLVSLGVLQLIAQRMDKKDGQNFVNTSQSVALGPKAEELLRGQIQVAFAVKVCPHSAHRGELFKNRVVFSQCT